MDNRALEIISIAALMAAAFILGRLSKWTPAVDPAAQLDANMRARFQVWLKRLWGIEERLVYTFKVQNGVLQNEGIAVKDVDTAVPAGLPAANVHVDPNHDILPWVLHTYNLAELRLREIQAVVKSRGPKFSDRQESSFQSLLKDARFLHCLCDAALHATSQNYAAIRGALLDCFIRYPKYTPTWVDSLDNLDAGGIVHWCPAPGDGLTICCRKTLFEIPSSDRVTAEPARVTCISPGAVKAHQEGIR